MQRSALLNKIAGHIGAASYLEVGVLNGKTFFAVDVADKTAVDPNFQFDPSLRSTEGCRFHEVPSDRFFQDHASSEKFDLIYLDGLHTFEQTLRDLNHALHHSHERSVIVLDDTLPNDCFSALPSQERCLTLRKKAQKPGKQWMGDVYKVVFYVHDFLPMLSYATITENHGQTILWRATRRGFKPAFADMVQLAAADYATFMEMDDVMRYESCDAAIARIPRSASAPAKASASASPL